MRSTLGKGLLVIALIGPTLPAFANVITDWDEKALVTVTPLASLGNPSKEAAAGGGLHQGDPQQDPLRRHGLAILQRPQAAARRLSIPASVRVLEVSHG